MYGTLLILTLCVVGYVSAAPIEDVQIDVEKREAELDIEKRDCGKPEKVELMFTGAEWTTDCTGDTCKTALLEKLKGITRLRNVLVNSMTFHSGNLVVFVILPGEGTDPDVSRSLLDIKDDVLKGTFSFTVGAKEFKAAIDYLKIYEAEPKDINECESSPCLNGGSCTDTDDSFTCACVGEFTGDKCETAPAAAAPTA